MQGRAGKLAGAASTPAAACTYRVGWSVSAASVQGTTLTVCPLERSTSAATSSAFQPEGVSRTQLVGDHVHAGEHLEAQDVDLARPALGGQHRQGAGPVRQGRAYSPQHASMVARSGFLSGTPVFRGRKLSATATIAVTPSATPVTYVPRAPMSRTGPWDARVFEVSMPRACSDRDTTAATARACTHQPSLSEAQTRISTISVGTYSAALPWARWAMNMRSAGSVGIWLPVSPRIARWRVTLAPSRNSRMPSRAMETMATVSVFMRGLLRWRVR